MPLDETEEAPELKIIQRFTEIKVHKIDPKCSNSIIYDALYCVVGDHPVV